MVTNPSGSETAVRQVVIASVIAFLVVGGFAFFFWQYLEGARDTISTSELDHWTFWTYFIGTAMITFAALLGPLRPLRRVALSLIVGTAAAAVAMGRAS